MLMEKELTEALRMDDRTRCLGKIRSALGYLPHDKRGPADCSRLFAEAGDSLLLERIRYRTTVEKQALLQIMAENSKALNLGVHPVPSTDAAAEKIVEIVRETSPEFSVTRQIIQHDHPDLAALQLWKKFAGESVQVHTSYGADKEIREKTIASFVGITAPRWAVAESATIVEVTGPGRPRSSSLVPSVHIAVINVKNMLASLSEAYALLRQDPPSHSFIFISGPSKTADIEAQLVHGAHGPKQMDIVVIDENMVREQVVFKGSGLFSPF